MVVKQNLINILNKYFQMFLLKNQTTRQFVMQMLRYEGLRFSYIEQELMDQKNTHRLIEFGVP